MIQKIGVLFANVFMLIVTILTTSSYHDQFLVSKYGAIVEATVVDKYCPGKNSYIRVTYNNKTDHLWVSYSNCINRYPDSSKIKVKYLDGYPLRFIGSYSVSEFVVMETIVLTVLIMTIVSTYQVFFPKKLPEEN